MTLEGIAASSIAQPQQIQPSSSVSETGSTTSSESSTSELQSKNGSESKEQDITKESGDDPDTSDELEDCSGLCYRDRFYDSELRDWVLVPSAKKTEHSKEFDSYAILAYRDHSEKKIYQGISIRIQSPTVASIFKKLYCDARGINVDDPNAEVDPKYFWWAREELQSASDEYEKAGEEKSFADVQAALSFIDSEYSEMNDSLASMLPSSINFRYLWAILPPNTILVGKDELDEYRAYSLRKHAMTTSVDGGVGLQVTTEHVDSNGIKFGLVDESQIIPEFSGRIDIEELPLSPLAMHPQRKTIRQQILERNEKQLLFHHNEAQLKEYTGHALTLKNRNLVKFNVHKRIIADPVGMEQLQPDQSLLPHLRTFRRSEEEASASKVDRNARSGRRYVIFHGSDFEFEGEVETGSRGKIITEAKDLSKEQILLLPGRLYGYSLGDGVWGIFSVTNTSDVVWNDQMFSSLVMEPTFKDLIINLVQAHASGLSGFDDFVQGKGKGLIGLLFGPPGLGKTLTAEAIAEASRLPLYAVSSGALGNGYGVDEVSESLSRILELSTRWNAVLLLDEADVFLAKRDEHNLQRNAVVSIFLRELEYYPGILILTTNQARVIDPAFKSRIHFCHSYPKLDTVARKKIWSDFITRTEQQQAVQVSLTDSDMYDFAKLDLNGRQIKNVLSIAVKLAAHSGNSLTGEGIRAATRLFSDFAAMDDGHEGAMYM